MASGRLLITSALTAVVVLAAAGPVAAEVSEDQIRSMLAERFDVDVLRVTEGQADGRAVYRVTVMNKGGAFNEAFQVNTLVVDRQTGELVRQFRHRSSGYDLPGAQDRQPNRNPGGSRIGRTWR
ncbi:MAG: hypothetical protein QNJ92_03150 [Alphaproteobacteria bacterium]|nr:hypothetical protein [Alphaproteobacteria bacterium]